MTSTHALELAHQIIENDPQKTAPLVKLLYAFKVWHADPLGQAMMREVLNGLFAETDYCDVAIERFATEADEKSRSIAA